MIQKTRAMTMWLVIMMGVNHFAAHAFVRPSSSSRDARWVSNHEYHGLTTTMKTTAAPNAPCWRPLLQSQENTRRRPSSVSSTEVMLMLSSNADDSSSSSSSSSGKSLVTVLSDLGESLQTRAEKATANSYQANNRTEKILYTLQTCGYYLMFLLYRASKGMVTLLPSVGRKVYHRIELMLMSYDDFLLVQQDDITIPAVANNNIRWSTRLTASILAGFVTFSYTIGGALRVGKKFCSTLVHKSSLPQAFESAAQQVLQNEVRMNRLLQNGGSTLSNFANGLNSTSGGGGDNNNSATSSSSSSGLSP